MNEVHVIPVGEGHIDVGFDCWCGPEYLAPTEARRVLHRAEAVAMRRCGKAFVVVHRSVRDEANDSTGPRLLS